MELNQKHLDWLGSVDRGISSDTIFHVMTKLPRELIVGKWRPDAPHDPADFGRCYRLIKLFPEWESRLDEMRIYPEWNCIIDNWKKWKKLWEKESSSGKCPELYNDMDKITHKEYYEKMAKREDD